MPPPRRLVPELLDDPAVPDDVRARSLRDVARSNVLFGGRRAATRAVAAALRALRGAGRREVTLLDVGTGAGDIPRAAREAAAALDVRLTTIGVDLAPSLARDARQAVGLSVCGDALRLPFAGASVDVVTCCQVLHHFDDAAAGRLVAELHRVARARAIVCDLRRSRVAALGFWLASFPLGFHPVTRHDGPVSVLRGFTAPELQALVRAATGCAPQVRHDLGWRLTASWAPRSLTPETAA